MSEHIIIVGGGLSGLSLAWYLTKKNKTVTILEATTRLGGRIETIAGKTGTPLELGATWFSDMHSKLKELIDELGLDTFPQFSGGISLFQTKSFEPPQQFFITAAEQPSYRIAGGTYKLIEALLNKLKGQTIITDNAVTKIDAGQYPINITTNNGEVYTGDKVVLCMPPQLIGDQINILPKLSGELSSLLSTVHTWMAGSVKFVLEYNHPFWRNSGYSGMLFSHAGIVTEMYDHTNFEENKFGFTGFLNGGAAGYEYSIRKQLVLEQLSGLLGNKAMEPLSYNDKIWSDKFTITSPQVIRYPHQHNGHELLQSGYMDGRLFFGGSETSSNCPGYMEGAVVAAHRVATNIN
ncbi:amine oxidase [Chitinophaga pinensis DSM 2588]|uniref:Amine oxidase n=2 Tax=Chitinophaga pinensis TaxID=79329 RepID=A0A979G9Q7_CHIPD|nr:NAD(P)/FAD-dependent oxidoreductase [Chitinophaga pinensis]ACU63390.1 amine oxidase [Chitinophaga pinensis DSM 2588]